MGYEYTTPYLTLVRKKKNFSKNAAKMSSYLFLEHDAPQSNIVRPGERENRSEF